ncbi:MAG: hypothetical protein JNL74_03070 [Fibrobacteres bacterium]|nr:hypothetical protein [Fibrobacterota bacterium]
MKTVTVLLFVAISIVGQANSWMKVTSNLPDWGHPGLFYSQNSKEFILTMGNQTETGSNSVYSVQVFTHELGKWINALPNPALYGVWADSTGVAYGNGRVGGAVFGTYYWIFKNIFYGGVNYLRPNMGASFTPRAYNQFCLNTDNGKAYFYVNNSTFTYDPATRLWDTLSVATHPNSGSAEGWLKWGSLVYDQHNHEVVLFGGGGVDNIKGTPETWTLNPTTKVWSKLSLAVQPSARAHAQMAYDPATKKIVLFGGDHLDCLLNDTWVYDCITKTWSKKNPALRPSPRAGHALLYLPKSGKIILMGGYSYSWSQANAFEMWKYDIASDSWEMIKRFQTGETWPKMSSMRPTLCGLSAVDAGDTILAMGDSAATMYSFNAAGYRMVCDPSVTDASAGATYGTTKDTIATRGGWTEPTWFTNSVAAPDTAANEAVLRSLTVGTWTLITPPKTTQSEYRAWGSTVYDSDRDLFLKWAGGHVAHCGTDVPQYSISNNRWKIGYVPEWPVEWDGYNNPAAGVFTFNGRPYMPMHPVKAYGYDVRSKRMVFMYNRHTYIYNPDSMDWEKRNIHSSFGSSGYGTGLVSTPRGLVCVGGNSGGTSSPSQSYVYLFEPDSFNWRKLPQTGATMPGYYADAAGAVYDSKRDRILLIRGSSGSVATLHSYDFATGVATKLVPMDSSITTGAGDYYRECSYIPNLDIVFVQARIGNANLIYDCANNKWSTMTVNGFSATMNDRGTGFMYDAKRNILWNCDHYSKIYAIRLDAALTAKENGKSLTDSDELKVYPSPANPVLNINLPGAFLNAGSVDVKIYRADGRQIADLSKQVVKGKVVWNAKGNASGIYVVKATLKGKVWQSKAVLSR